MAVKASELDYDLPEALIAQAPLAERDASRLLVVQRHVGVVRHAHVRDLPTLLPPSLVVVNDTRVMPARLHGNKESGGQVEFLLLRKLDAARAEDETWSAMGRASKPLRPGRRVAIDPALTAEVLAKHDDGTVTIRLRAEGDSVHDAVARVGAMPLPPYIQRAAERDDDERYQTVYATHEGSVAAPTAGLHFTPALLDALGAHGHTLTRLTLHVGPGTFQPLRTDDLDAHVMHAEQYELGEATAAAVARAKEERRAVLAVGTTSMRTLESCVDESGVVRAGRGESRLFIRPPYTFRAVDALLTNFHLPRSTLLALVMAFAGIDVTRAAYAEAVRERYRFFSYGDAMLLLP